MPEDEPPSTSTCLDFEATSGPLSVTSRMLRGKSPTKSDSPSAEQTQDGSTVQRKGRVVMQSFVVQVSGQLPPHGLDRDVSVRRQTVLQAAVRDQSALYGFLAMLRDLDLDLVDLRQVPHREEPGVLEPWPENPSSASMMLMIEVVIRGAVGDLALAALRDHAEVTHLSTRLVLPDRLLLGDVLEWARTAGAAVEYAVDAPAPTNAPGTPPLPLTPSVSSVTDEVPRRGKAKPGSTD